jgi:outer membrane biosynthesis protein TonB
MRKILFVVSLIVLTSMLGLASAQQKPEQKPEQKVEQKAEQKPAQKPEQKPEAKPEQKPEPKPEQKPDESASQAGKILIGAVVTVDATKNEIVIKNEAGMEVHLSIVASTKIFREDKAIALADVKVGDTLTCECENSGEGCKAKGIVVTTPSP